MRRPLTMLAAAAIAVTGLSFAPAQAGVRAAPAVLDQSAPAADIMQVHRKRSRHRHHPYYSYYKPYPRYAYPRYVHPYPYASVSVRLSPAALLQEAGFLDPVLLRLGPPLVE
jgi:hypothetical protein